MARHNGGGDDRVLDRIVSLEEEVEGMKRWVDSLKKKVEALQGRMDGRFKGLTQHSRFVGEISD